MKVLIVSDTHRRMENFFKVTDLEAPLDLIIHCGDAEGSENMIYADVQCRVEIILGNNDFFSDLPREREFHLGGYKIWLTHGHNYYVSTGGQVIKEEAKSKGVDIVMYGHTHRPLIEIEEEVIALNPGSLTFPRQEGKRPSYIIMEINEDGKATFQIRYL